MFLAGNALHERWASLAAGAQFVVAETGFGTGLGFLCAWALWDESAPRDARLHFVSVEAYPLARDELVRALALWPQLAPYRDALLARWEPFAPGWHRLAFASGRVILTLLVGDVAAVLPRLDAAVDAWFLDGFTPARNPDMWSPAVLGQVARLSQPGATFATYTAASEVRRHLEAAGFAVRKASGFGRKREMLAGTLHASRAPPWRAPWFARPAARTGERRAIVVGSGPAGAATAASLAARGWGVEVLERRGDAGPAAAAKHQGVLYAHPSPSPHRPERARARRTPAHRPRPARRSRARPRATTTSAASCSSPATSTRPGGRPALRRSRCRARCFTRWTVRRPPRSPGSKCRRAGCSSRPQAGCTRRRSAPRCSTIRVSACAVHTMRSRSRGPGAVEPFATGRSIVAEAPVVVIAGGADSAGFPQTRHLPLRTIRGQITLVPATAASAALRTVLCGEGYVAPARGGVHSLGATHKFRDREIDVRASEHVGEPRAPRPPRAGPARRARAPIGSIPPRSRASRACAAPVRTTCR